jgi:hypothetical protein
MPDQEEADQKEARAGPLPDSGQALAGQAVPEITSAGGAG